MKSTEEGGERPGPLPVVRPRRLRVTDAVRAMVREHHLLPDDLVYPIFVAEGTEVRMPIESMPGVFRIPVDQLPAEVDSIGNDGLRAVLLFGIPESKDAIGSGSYDEHGVVQRAIRTIKRAAPEMVVIADTCLCEYTDHGHCGIVRPSDGYLLNDETLAVLRKVAVSQAAAGADIVAPSGMIDGMVHSIRDALDGAGYAETGIMSYAVKYASGFYGPFRDAADGAPRFGDRRSHQMDPGNVREALREARLDAAEGADFLIVKPALAYLDVVRAVRELATGVPIVAYNVSGEYAMVKAAAERGWLDERRTVMESLIGMKRAGADIIISYHARDVARWLREVG